MDKKNIVAKVSAKLRKENPQEKVKELEAQIAEAQEAINEMFRYLQSSKFHKDTTVQVKDVVDRLQIVRMSLN